MNLVFWVLQVLLALHTALGATWKWSNSPERAMPSLAAIPEGVWLAMSGLELLAAVALILPLVNRRVNSLTPFAAAFVAAEMLLFSGVHLASGSTTLGPVIYWLVVAVVCAAVGWGARRRRAGAAAEPARAA